MSSNYLDKTKKKNTGIIFLQSVSRLPKKTSSCTLNASWKVGVCSERDKSHQCHVRFYSIGGNFFHRWSVLDSSLKFNLWSRIPSLRLARCPTPAPTEHSVPHYTGFASPCYARILHSMGICSSCLGLGRRDSQPGVSTVDLDKNVQVLISPLLY